jgi:hypothetical protein
MADRTRVDIFFSHPFPFIQVPKHTIDKTDEYHPGIPSFWAGN